MLGQMRMHVGMCTAMLATSHLPGRVLEVEVFEGKKWCKRVCLNKGIKYFPPLLLVEECCWVFA